MQPFDQIDDYQRVAAEFKEVVVTADLLQPQQILPDLCQSGFHLTDRGFIAASDHSRQVGGRKRLTVEFAVGGERESVERHKGTGQHILGEALGKLLTQFSGNQLNAVQRPYIGDQTFLARLVFTRQHHRFAHTATLHQLGLYLAKLNAEAAQFNLKVIATEIVDIAVRTPAAEVAGLVHTSIRIGGERIGKETLGRQFGAVQVTAGNAGTGDMDFAGHTERNGLTVGIENIDPGIGDRAADMTDKALRPVHPYPG